MRVLPVPRKEKRGAGVERARDVLVMGHRLSGGQHARQVCCVPD